MNTGLVDITQHTVLHHESLGSPSARARTIKLFRDNVIKPSLLALDHEIDTLRASGDVGDEFVAEDLAELFQATVEGYLLTMQSMWERGLRTLLIEREKRLHQGARVADIEKANWGGGPKDDLKSHFARLIGLPMQSFDQSYADLDLLQNFGSAIRHGDGRAARRVHELCPSLWWNWLGPGDEIHAGPFHIKMPLDSEAHPEFASITLPQSVLEQMIASVRWFWEDLEYIRCNSFSDKTAPVVERLAAWPARRSAR